MFALVAKVERERGDGNGDDGYANGSYDIGARMGLHVISHRAEPGAELRAEVSEKIGDASPYFRSCV